MREIVSRDDMIYYRPKKEEVRAMNMLVDYRWVVDTLMLSPFYWVLTLKERLNLAKHLLESYRKES